MSALVPSDSPSTRSVLNKAPVSRTAVLAFLFLVLAFAIATWGTGMSLAADGLHNFNYFHLHLPAVLVHYFLVAVISGAIVGPFPCAIIFATIARRQIQRSDSALRGSILATIVLLPNILWLILILVVFTLFNPTSLGGSGATHRGHMKWVMRLCDDYADQHAGHYPPGLAIFVDIYGPQMGYFFLHPRESRVGPPSTRTPYNGPFPTDQSAWPSLAAEVDAHSDIFYLGGDLTKGPELAAQPNIILMYTKLDIGFKTSVVYNSSKYRYDILPHRVVAFANGKADTYYTPDLPALFAAHNAARAALGLPPQTLDVQPPLPSIAPTPPR